PPGVEAGDAGLGPQLRRLAELAGAVAGNGEALQRIAPAVELEADRVDRGGTRPCRRHRGAARQKDHRHRHATPRHHNTVRLIASFADGDTTRAISVEGMSCVPQAARPTRCARLTWSPASPAMPRAAAW